jgi:hypothetical protein
MDDYCKEFLLKNLMDHFEKIISSNQWQLFSPNNNIQWEHFQSYSVFLNDVKAQMLTCISMLHKIKKLNTNNIHNSTKKMGKTKHKE